MNASFFGVLTLATSIAPSCIPNCTTTQSTLCAVAASVFLSITFGYAAKEILFDKR